jgi:hypothetical protein
MGRLILKGQHERIPDGSNEQYTRACSAIISGLPDMDPLRQELVAVIGEISVSVLGGVSPEDKIRLGIQLRQVLARYRNRLQ